MGRGGLAASGVTECESEEVQLEKRGDTCQVEVTFGKIQPGASVWTQERLFIGTMDAREVILTGKLFGDNFEPVPAELRITSRPKVRNMTLSDLRAKAAEGPDGD